MHTLKSYIGQTTNATPTAVRNSLFLFAGIDEDTKEGADIKFRILRTQVKPNAPEEFAELVRRAKNLLMYCRLELHPDGYISGRIRYTREDGSTGEAEATDAERLSREMAENYERLRKAAQSSVDLAAETARRRATDVDVVCQPLKSAPPEVNIPQAPGKPQRPTRPDLDF